LVTHISCPSIPLGVIKHPEGIMMVNVVNRKITRNRTPTCDMDGTAADFLIVSRTLTFVDSVPSSICVAVISAS